MTPLWVFGGLAQMAGLTMAIVGGIRRRDALSCRLTQNGLRLKGNFSLDSKPRRSGMGLDLTYRF